MAIFVGSDNNDSKIRDNRVGLAISTSNPSSPDTGDAYYNSTDNKLTVYNGSDHRIRDWWWWNHRNGCFQNTLSNGQTVIVSTDGKVNGVSSITQSWGAVFESGILYTSAVTILLMVK